MGTKTSPGGSRRPTVTDSWKQPRDGGCKQNWNLLGEERSHTRKPDTEEVSTGVHLTGKLVSKYQLVSKYLFLLRK